MKINSRDIGTIHLLEIEGEADAEHASYLKKFLAKTKEGAGGVVLDLSRVSFIDSTGLRILISLMRQLKEQHRHLKLAALQDEVRSIFEITRLYKVFELSDTVESAIADLQKKK